MRVKDYETDAGVPGGVGFAKWRYDPLPRGLQTSLLTSGKERVVVEMRWRNEDSSPVAVHIAGILIEYAFTRCVGTVSLAFAPRVHADVVGAPAMFVFAEGLVGPSNLDVRPYFIVRNGDETPIVCTNPLNAFETWLRFCKNNPACENPRKDCVTLPDGRTVDLQ